MLPNTRVLSHLKPLLTDIRVGIDANTIIMGTSTPPIMSIDRLMRQELSKEATDLIEIIEQMDLVYMCKASHPTNTECTFF